MSSAPERAGAPPSAKEAIHFDPNNSLQQMAIVEKYERFIEYLYPIVQNIPRKHGVARDKVLHSLFDQVDLFIIAGKSNQASRLYSADANLALMRFWLRFLASPARKIITPNQHRVAQVHLAEVGKMLGGWVKTMKVRG